jgi:hypothetical protein
VKAVVYGIESTSEALAELEPMLRAQIVSAVADFADNTELLADHALPRGKARRGSRGGTVYLVAIEPLGVPVLLTLELFSIPPLKGLALIAVTIHS